MKTHTFRDWYSVHNPSQWHLFRLRMEYRDLGWKYFGFRPWRMFKATGFIPELVYYWKCRLWRKYNVVKVRSLPPTWVDRDRLLLHAAFEILRDVVEKEDWLNNTVYYQEDADYRDRWQEVATLYDWWINRRPASEAAEEAAIKNWHVAFTHERSDQDLLMNAYNDLERAGDQEDEDMLVRLCRIRPYLWT